MTTGDVVHYGAVYGSVNESVAKSVLESKFRSRLESLFAKAFEERDLERAYQLSLHELKSDQREILSVLTQLMGRDAAADLLSFELSDYAPVFDTDPSCLVASALIAYKNRNASSSEDRVDESVRGPVNQTGENVQSKTIGVLGGMGPAATIEFFRRLVAATPAAIDQTHLRILIDNNPQVPDRTEAIIGRGPDPGPVLADMARGLAESGAEFLTMPCNTGHVFQSAIREAVSIPFIDMIEETSRVLAAKTVGLLATTGTVRSGIYREVCDQRDIELLVPSEADQQLMMDIIWRVKAGGSGSSVREHASVIVSRLADRGATAVIAGCTEISLIPGEGMPIEWIDALDCLVEASIRMALNVETQPLHEETE